MSVYPSRSIGGGYSDASDTTSCENFACVSSFSDKNNLLGIEVDGGHYFSGMARAFCVWVLDKELIDIGMDATVNTWFWAFARTSRNHSRNP